MLVLLSYGYLTVILRLESYASLPPVDGGVGGFGTGLVVLEVGQHRRIDTYVEGVRFVQAERHDAGCHGPAVQVARDVDGR